MKNLIKSIIVDDEPHAVDLLKDSLRNINDQIEIIGSYISWEEACIGLKQTTCDLLFMDISIHGRNSMGLLQSLPDLNCEIIFVTAYSNFALPAFRFPTSGYILKPINEVELKHAIDNALTRISHKALSPPINQHFQYKIGIPDNKAINYIDMRQIIYLEALNAYTKVITLDGELISSYNIGKFKDILPQSIFFLAHRSYLINLNLVRRYETSGFIIMENGKEVPVSKNHRDALLQLISSVKVGG